MKKIITRFAPSPTGFLHIGGVRTALINFIVVKQLRISIPESKFLLRIEDTDKIRSKDIYKQSILNGLRWMGINWDNEPIIQSQRINRHQEIAHELLKRGYAYKCICTSEDLQKKRIKNIKKLCLKCEDDSKIQNLSAGFAVRVKITNLEKSIVQDLILGKVEVKNQEIDNFILLRNDGTPTYMLSVVVDDYDMGVNLIIRGDDHLNNTFRQLQIYKHMNWPIPQYGHLPLIHGEDGSKLSKRHGAVDINELRTKGYLPQSIINNLILLGWSPKNTKEFIIIDEIIKIFNIKELSKSSSIFNYNKLNHFNNYYLKQDNNLGLFINYCQNNSILRNFLRDDEDKLMRVFAIYKKNINYFKEFEIIAQIYFIKNFISVNNSLLIDNNFNTYVKDFNDLLKELNEWRKEVIESLIKKFIESKNIKFVSFGKPMRLVLTNKKDGPSISEILFILGKKNSILRLNNYINSIN